MSTPRDLVILGSTGSIGTQALDVVRRNPGRFRVVALAAGGSDPRLLAAQAMEFGAGVVAVSQGTAAEDVHLALFTEAKRRGYDAGEFRLPKILVGPQAAEEAAGLPCDVVLNGITGAVGLRPTLAALEAGRTLALANKESLIIGGDLVRRAALDAGSTLALANKESLIIGGPVVTDRAAPGQIVPVDSEHSALAQCLRGGTADEVRRLVLTASGGPFRGWTRERLGSVTPEQALNHPTWDMGPVVTIISATLVNKSLEVIDKHLLFGIPMERIEVVVHPQSVVHSMVEFFDGSTLAQASPPDMRIPIALGMAWPDRVPDAAPACDWSQAASWEFFPLDTEAFPAVDLARRAGEAGRTAPAVFNAANEECVEAFRAGSLPFPAIVDTIASVLREHDVPSEGDDVTLEDVLAADAWARERAREVTASRPDPEPEAGR